MRRSLVIFLCFCSVLGHRCLPFRYVTNGSKCGDNTRPKGFYCGVGKCRLWGTWCERGCRTADNLGPVRAGDVVMCTWSGSWWGALALNRTHVVYPFFDRGFTRIVQEFKPARARLGRYCRVETSMFDHYARLLGFSPVNDSFQTNVNIFSGSWELQVTHWKYGVAFNPAELIGYFGEFKEELKM